MSPEFIYIVSDAVKEVLKDVVGLGEPDMEDPLHRRLVEAIERLGPGASLGNRLVAVGYEFNWELRDAGIQYARAKTDYEHYVARRKLELFAEDPKLSVAKADVMATGTDEAYELHLAYRLAELREQSMRKFLDNIGRALDNHRTDRADKRAADVEHGRTVT